MTAALSVTSSPEKSIGSPAKTAAFFCVNNPLVWVVHSDLPWTGSPTIDDYRLKVEVYENTTDLYYTEYYFPDTLGNMTIDLSEVLRSLLYLENTCTYAGHTAKEDRLSMEIKAVFTGYLNAALEQSEETPLEDSFFIIHAAKQVGDVWGSTMGDYESSDITPGKFLTFFDKPKYWSGYPFVIDFILRTKTVSFQYLYKYERTREFDGTETAWGVQGVDEFLDEVIHVRPGTSYGTTIDEIDIKMILSDGGDDFEVTETKTIQYVNPCGLSPLYVRWINELAGSEYWLFKINQVNEFQISEAVYKRLFITDISTATATHQQRSNRKLKKYTIGAEKLSLNEWQVLARQLGGSIECQVYNTDDSKWYTALVVARNYQTESRNTGHNIEIELIMPELYNQSR